MPRDPARGLGTSTVLACAVVLGCTACSRGAASDAAAVMPTLASNAAPHAVAAMERDAHGRPRSYSVVAYGYNYTDLYIDSFEVDGAGGGNLAVSTADSPGGGHTCCASVTSGLPPGTPFTIKWTRDRKRWCEQEVLLKKPIPTEPRYLEVHFYPNGKIDIEATQRASAPRLKLDRASYARRHETNNVNNDEKYSRCHDGY